MIKFILYTGLWAGDITGTDMMKRYGIDIHYKALQGRYDWEP